MDPLVQLGFFTLYGLTFWLIGLLFLVAQLCCVVHLFRTGRPYWWLWAIFGFPLLGTLAYLLIEVQPSWRRMDWQSLRWRMMNASERIAVLEQDVAESSTVKNRLRLADELHAAGQFDRECEVLSAGLRGAFKDDATVLLRLGEANLEAGRVDEAERLVAQASPERSVDLQRQKALLQARILGRLGRQQQAEAQFRESMVRRTSEGPRYYFAEFLWHAGRREEAIALLNDILLQYRRGTSVWRHHERRWFHAAKQMLKSPPKDVTPAAVAEPYTVSR